MSLDLEVYIEADRMPTTKAWFAAIKQAGFPLALTEEVDPNTVGGFLPVLLAGEDSGFEFYLSPLAPDDLPPALRTGEFSGNTVAAFRFSGEDEVSAPRRRQQSSRRLPAASCVICKAEN